MTASATNGQSVNQYNVHKGVLVLSSGIACIYITAIQSVGRLCAGLDQGNVQQVQKPEILDEKA